MNATLTIPNGRHRRSLNDSIGRLDEMIDGLASAIPETIRDTLKEAVADSIATGVKAAVVEVLTNRELQEALRPEQRGTHMREKLRTALERLRESASRWVRAVTDRVTCVPRRVSSRLRTLWSFRKPLAIALGIGALVGLTAAWTPPWLSATLSGIGSAALSLTVHAGLWARRTLGGLLSN